MRATSLKKFTYTFAALAIAGTSLTACSSSGTGNTASTEKGALAMSYAGLDITIWNDVLSQMRPIVEGAGYELLTSDPQWDVNRQVSDWETWIQRGDVRALMAFPVQNDSVIPTTSKAVAAGIPVLGYASKWEGVNYAVLIDCKAEGEKMGKDTGEWAKDHGAGAETIAIVADVATDLGSCRVNGMQAGLKSIVPEADIQVLSGTSRDDGYNNVKSHLIANPDTRVWLASGDDNGQGAYQALRDSGVEASDPDYLFVALDASASTVDVIKSNTFWRWGYMLPADVLAESQANMLIAAANGEPLEDARIISIKVDASNAGENAG